jgi:transcriptional regulator with XRE-family HTH domain
MPKKPKIDCPLWKLREISGKTQVEFARLLGCSPSTIKKIEAGDNSKLNGYLIMTAANVFCVSPDSLVPPSTQPTQLHGEPYTKEFFENWWKNGPELIKSIIQNQKIALVRDFELILAAANRIPGMGVVGVTASFQFWMIETLKNFQLFPHYETELDERKKRGKKSTNQLNDDLEFARLFRENKAKFIQEAFEADAGPTLLSHHLAEIKKFGMDLNPDVLKQPKAQRLKSLVALGTKSAKKGFAEPPAFLYFPKLKR